MRLWSLPFLSFPSLLHTQQYKTCFGHVTKDISGSKLTVFPPSEFFMPAEEIASDSSFRSISLALISVVLLYKLSTVVSKAERKQQHVSFRRNSNVVTKIFNYNFV